MNLREIVKKWLEDNGYSGLAGDECGCELSDLFPCEYPNMDGCRPGYKIGCPGVDKCPNGEECPMDTFDGKAMWCISTKKPRLK